MGGLLPGMPKISSIRKYLTFFIVLAILLLVWIGVNKWQYGKMPWEMLKEANDRLNQTATSSSESQATTSKESAPQLSQTERQTIMKGIAGKISDLSPTKPVLGGQWYVTRFWFVLGGDDYAYVEYEDGHIMRRILASVDSTGENPTYASGDNFSLTAQNYKVVAYFEPGENDWELKQGEDTMVGKQLDLYEFGESKNEWVKKN